MRDRIFECLLEPEQKGQRPQCKIVLRVHNGKSLAVLLVNKQFHAEYSDCALRCAALTIEDHPLYDESLLSHFRVPAGLRYVRRVICNLGLIDTPNHDAGAEVTMHFDGIDQVIRDMTPLSSLSFNFYLGPQYSSDSTELLLVGRKSPNVCPKTALAISCFFCEYELDEDEIDHE